ncbi:MAG TPA: hypothetical protein VJT69_00075 [Pyrinomonadaceae bacterium]|nr:hypothetical protein [Pyrinomonadaceae bacterium]
MNKQRIRPYLANLLVFLITGLSSAWLSTPVEQTTASTAPYTLSEEPHIPTRFQRLSELPLGDFWRHLQFISEQEGWYSDSEHLWHTSDGGKTWCGLPDLPESDSCRDCYLGIQREFRRVLFRDIDNGLAIDGHGFLYESTDAGTSWQRLDTSITFESIGYMNDTNAWVISAENELVRVSLAPRH